MSPKSAQLLCLPLPCGTWFPSNAAPSPPDTHPCAHSARASGLRAIPGTSQAFSPPQGLCTYCLLLCSFPHHSGLCSDVPFRKSCLDLPQPASVSFHLYLMGFLVYYLPLVVSSSWEDICPLLRWGPRLCAHLHIFSLQWEVSDHLVSSLRSLFRSLLGPSTLPSRE